MKSSEQAAAYLCISCSCMNNICTQKHQVARCTASDQTLRWLALPSKPALCLVLWLLKWSWIQCSVLDSTIAPHTTITSKQAPGLHASIHALHISSMSMHITSLSKQTVLLSILASSITTPYHDSSYTSLRCRRVMRLVITTLSSTAAVTLVLHRTNLSIHWPCRWLAAGAHVWAIPVSCRTSTTK